MTLVFMTPGENGTVWTWADGSWHCSDGERTRTPEEMRRCYGDVLVVEGQ